MEERALRVEVEQMELDNLLEEILEQENDAKKELDSKDLEKKSKADKEKSHSRGSEEATNGENG